MKAHVFAARDTLDRIALRYGLHADDIWGHDKNKDVRQRREDPMHLAPGDLLIIPDPPAREPASVSAQSGNSYTVAVPTTVHLRIKLQDRDGSALAGVAFRAEGPAKAFENAQGFYEGTTDGEGVAEFDVVASVYELAVVVPSKKLRLPIHVGTLPTEARVTFAWNRLHNLGYIRHERKGADRKTLLGRALQRFQRDESLAVTGELNDETFARLRDIHGV